MTISNNGINEKMKYMKTSMEIDSCWSLRNADKREGRETVPAEVPGDLYSDLLRAGIIDDPYYRDNELAALKLAGNDYILPQIADSCTTIQGADVLQSRIVIDNQVLIDYITDTLGGTIPEEYSDPYGQGRIVFLQAEGE